MNSKAQGILIYSKVFKENDLYIKFLTNNDEILSGIVYGGLSRKKRSLFQNGFFLNFNINRKLNRPLSISADLMEPYLYSMINNKYKLNCLLSTISLVNLSIIEGQKVDNIFNITKSFIVNMINKDNWILFHCKFLLNLLKVIGYEIDYKNVVEKKYFDLQKLEFTTNKTNSSLLFPHKLLYEENIKSINYTSINNIFQIFENIFTKHHLTNLNLYLPNQYLLFKKLIIDHLSKYE
tara:strand:- start:1191 stop:1898 length:708 start_codon:yes stop_codon:yes gene_type:complete